MSVAITRPTNLTLQDWAGQVLIDLDRYGSFGRLMADAQWQDWAMQFFNNSSLGRNFPNPYQFSDWRDWAERFCGSLA